MTEETQAPPPDPGAGGQPQESASPDSNEIKPLILSESGESKEGKTEGGEEGGKKPDDAPAEPSGAPEAYEDFTMPEGLAFGDERLTEFKTLAKDLNLTQEQAQRMADFGAQAMQTVTGGIDKRITATIADWNEQTRKDPEIGGDKLDANLATAQRALKAFGSEKLLEFLGGNPIAYHPEFVRFLVTAGNSITPDDSPLPGGSGKQPGPERGTLADLAASLYTSGS